MRRVSAVLALAVPLGLLSLCGASLAAGARLGSVGTTLLFAQTPDVSRQLATSLEKAYFALIERYRQGDFRASSEIKGWKERDVRKANEALWRFRVRAHVGATGEVSARFWAAATMMHTDAGLAALTQETVDSTHLEIAYRMIVLAPGFPHALSLSDRKTDRQTQHWTPLLDELDARLEAFTFRNWLLAVTRYVVDRMAYDLGRALLREKEANTLLEGTDRELMLAAGSLEEGAAFFAARERTTGVQAATAWRADVGTPNQASSFERRSQQDARQALAIEEGRRVAEHLYRRVLAVDSNYHEARLRLGRVLSERGALPESAGQLDRVLAESRNVRQSYLAALFLGASREKEGRLDDAIAAYSRALDIHPQCQVARVALASALERKGDVKAARAAVLPLARRNTRDSDYQDPWWTYAMGQGEEGRAGLASLRAAVVGR